MIIVWVPVQTVSEANSRGHWSIRHRRVKKQRRAAYYSCLDGGVNSSALSDTEMLIVTLVRVTKTHQRLDTDNLASSLKAVRDGVADALGIEDNSPRVEWRYDQRDGVGNAVEVEFTGGNIQGVLFRERLESASP
jgi:crossover junction endodeoxyribonuclease RusA